MKYWQWGDAVVQEHDLAALRAALAPLGVIHVEHPVAPEAAPWLRPAQLSPEEQAQLLVAVDGVFRQLQQERGYQERDLVVLYPEHPQLAELDERFAPTHLHEDEEVRYILDGEGVFGFVLPDGRQLEVTVDAGDYLHIPAGVEHWFRLNARRRIKAVRYFSACGGWTPVYTQRQQRAFSPA